MCEKSKSAEIKAFVIKFFEENSTEKAFELMAILKEKYGINIQEAHTYISGYLSKCWETI